MICMSILAAQLICTNPRLTFREFYSRVCGPWPGVTGEQTTIVQERVLDGVALYADYLAARQERKCP